jgi:acyl dehydratase
LSKAAALKTLAAFAHDRNGIHADAELAPTEFDWERSGAAGTGGFIAQTLFQADERLRLVSRSESSSSATASASVPGIRCP